MHWDDLRFLLALGRTGTMADAARVLGVAHSTVYRRLLAFEEKHGARVFERLPDRYVATEAGERLLVIAADVETKMREAESSLAGDAAIDGRVVVTAPEALAIHWISALDELRARHAGLTIVLDVSAEPRSLLRREADVAVRLTASPPESLVGSRLGEVAFAVFVARHLDAATAPWVRLAEPLAQSPHGRWERAQEGSVALESTSRMALLEAVERGLGKGLLPCALGDVSPLLQRVGAPVAELTAPLWLLTHADLKKSARVAVVMEALRAFFAGRGDLLAGRS